MSAQAWMIMGIVGFALAAALLLAAVLLFIRWRIPAVVGDLSGRTERKQIEKLRQDHAAAAKKVAPRPQAFEYTASEEPWQPSEDDGTAITDILGGQGETDDTDILSEVTDILEVEDPNATTLLDETDAAAQPVMAGQPAGKVEFQVVKSVQVTHTSEVIE